MPVAAVGETVAVKTTACPVADGFTLEVSVVVVAAFTICVNAAEVLVPYVASPVYNALIEWVPAVRPEVEQEVEVPHVAVPPFSVAVPSC